LVTVIEIIPVNTAALPIFALKPMSTFTSPQPVAKASAEKAHFLDFVMILINLPQLHFHRERGRGL
jgi:hypothetical protein